MNKTSYLVTRGTKAQRLDAFISSQSNLTRSRIQKLLKQGLITVDSRTEKASYKVKEGDTIAVTAPDAQEGMLVPEDIPLDVVYEDDTIVVVNKPPGLITHPAAGNRTGTLMNALAARCGKLASVGAPLRPGVVHRLDKDTSGLLVIAKTDEAYYNLVKQFKDREVEKHYAALLYGAVRSECGEIHSAIGRSASDRKKMSTKTRRGKEALTQYEVMRRFPSATLVKVKILTGRTHQIRVHFASIGHPVLGDRTYGRKVDVAVEGRKKIVFPRQMLHAYSLKLKHPEDGRLLEFSAPMPGDMEGVIRELGK
ncbi:MAG: RluA family pseudouridine synthase [Nitrospiraceae bacterium]|nr:MAG: RluA family pseudouridine synthase [Nitrospiraceae bacterium]